MTVRELIDLLQAFDGDLEVTSDGSDVFDVFIEYDEEDAPFVVIES